VCGNSSSLFNRNFVVGYFLPAIAFVGVSLILISGFGLLSWGFLHSSTDVLSSIVIASIISWLFGMSLFVANCGIIRLLEGYGKLNPAKVFLKFQIDRYRKLQERISRLDGEYLSYLSKNEEFPQESKNERNALMRQKAQQFPDEERWLLPTAFGNTVRAFEVYSRVMYGMESIQGWPRLLSIIPEKHHAFLDETKAKMDFWVNLWFIGLLVICEYIGAIISTQKINIPILPFVSLILSVFAAWRAKFAADEWGEFVKAAFDIYLQEPCIKLGFSSSVVDGRESHFWRNFSQAIIYRLPSSMPTREPSKSDKDNWK